jgi:hypothetical protein
MVVTAMMEWTARFFRSGVSACVVGLSDAELEKEGSCDSHQRCVRRAGP